MQFLGVRFFFVLLLRHDNYYNMLVRMNFLQSAAKLPLNIEFEKKKRRDIKFHYSYRKSNN